MAAVTAGLQLRTTALTASTVAILVAVTVVLPKLLDGEDAHVLHLGCASLPEFPVQWLAHSPALQGASPACALC